MTNATGNTIQLAMTHQINTSNNFVADYYPMLKEFYQKMIEKKMRK